MLQASIILFGMSWEKCLPFAEFSYNNSYQASLGKLLSKFSMDENAERLLTGQKPGKDNSLARI